MSRRSRVDLKIREEDAFILRELAAALNVKIADIIKLWPRCPRCNFPLAQVVSKIFCIKCNEEYKLS
jgi:hypothetical protein